MSLAVPSGFPASFENDEGLRFEAFSRAHETALWDLILSDRESPRRQWIWPGLRSRQDLVRHLFGCEKDFSTSKEFSYLLLISTGEAIGSFHIHAVNWCRRQAEIGYWIHHGFEGKGYVSQSVKRIEELLFEKGFTRIEIRCRPDNHRSCRVAERNDYRRESLIPANFETDDGLLDTVVFGKALYPAAN